VARFWARRVKWQWRMVHGGGTVAFTRRQRRWGRVVAKHEEGRGVWVKNPKPSHCGSVSGCNGAEEGGGRCCGVADTPSRANLWVEMGGDGELGGMVWVVVVWLCSPGTPSASPPLLYSLPSPLYPLLPLLKAHWQAV
jgi:hypothetical protein